MPTSCRVRDPTHGRRRLTSSVIGYGIKPKSGVIPNMSGLKKLYILRNILKLFEIKKEKPVCQNCYSDDKIILRCDCDQATVCEECHYDVTDLQMCDICYEHHVCQRCSLNIEANYRNDYGHGTYDDIRNCTYSYKCFFTKLVVVFSKIKNKADQNNTVEALQNIMNDMNWSNLHWDVDDDLGYVRNYIQRDDISLSFDLFMCYYAYKALNNEASTCDINSTKKFESSPV
jgi:hypothetical protein